MYATWRITNIPINVNKGNYLLTVLERYSFQASVHMGMRFQVHQTPNNPCKVKGNSSISILAERRVWIIVKELCVQVQFVSLPGYDAQLNKFPSFVELSPLFDADFIIISEPCQMSRLISCTCAVDSICERQDEMGRAGAVLLGNNTLQLQLLSWLMLLIFPPLSILLNCN